MRKVANSMANVMHFAILILIPLVANSLAIESFGQAQDFVVQQKPDKGKEFDWEAYEASIDRQVPNMDDEEYHHDDNSADEFSFILHDYGHFADKQSTPDSTFKVQKKEDCKHKCENICYNPLTHQCCGNNKTSTMVLWGFWTCSECEHKCEARCYPKTEGYKCCSGKVIPDAWQCCPHHCGSTCFDAYTKRCCNGQIIDRSRICCKHYCGDNCYEPFNTSCCNNEVVAKDALCCKDKCGNACYDKAKQQCCNGQAIPIGNKCCPVGQTVCGSACYMAGTHKCCHQRTIEKSLPCLSGSGNLVRITSGLSARKVGCFRDTGNRAIPTLEGKSRLLVEPYRSRHFAIEKCALAAAQRGWSVFAVQHQGWCASSPTASVTYNKYGPYNTCWNNKGGPWGNDVYVLEGNSYQRTTLGEICVFPFVYKGKSYHSCTRIDRNHPWCAVTPNYDVDGIWGFCKS